MPKEATGPQITLGSTRFAPWLTRNEDEDDSDEDEDDSDEEALEPCAECDSVPEDALKASTYAWCEDVSGKLCRGCSSFCGRCMQTRLIHHVTWFIECTADDVASACDWCWRPEDDDMPAYARGDGPARHALASLAIRFGDATLMPSFPDPDDQLKFIVGMSVRHPGGPPPPPTCSDAAVVMARIELFRIQLLPFRRRSAGATLVRAMRRSVFFEKATAKLHAVSAIFGKEAAAEFAADFGSG